MYCVGPISARSYVQWCLCVYVIIYMIENCIWTILIWNWGKAVLVVGDKSFYWGNKQGDISRSETWDQTIQTLVSAPVSIYTAQVGGCVMKIQGLHFSVILSVCLLYVHILMQCINVYFSPQLKIKPHDGVANCAFILELAWSWTVKLQNSYSKTRVDFSFF
jgi:hypothetical protein